MPEQGVSTPSGEGDYVLSEPIGMVLADNPDVTIAQVHGLRLRLGAA